MNICIVSPTYPYQGSAECIFVEALVKMGHICTIIAPFSMLTYMQGKIKKSVYYEHRKVNEDGFVNIYKPRVFTYKDLAICGVSYSSYIAGKSIERTIEKHHLKFDLIYCHFFVQGFRAYNFARKNHIPMVIATGESTIKKLNKPFKAFTLNEFKEYVKGVVCVSTKNRDECIELGYATADKCEVIPNAVNLPMFIRNNKRELIRKSLGLTSSDIAIISVGEFSERKGQNRLIDAVTKLRNVGCDNLKIVFVGRALDRKFKIKNEDCIVFQNAVKHKDLPDYLHAADIFVLPTLREGCCNAIIEAMACGLPIISSDKSFNYDILDNTNSILVDPMDIDAISDAIGKLYSDSSYRKKMGNSAFLKAQNLSIEKRAKKIMEFITQKTGIQ